MEELKLKTRTISAIIVLAIFIPLILIGGFWYNLGVYILSLIALNEFIKIKESKKELPSFIKFISFIVLSLIVLNDSTSKNIILTIDYRIISGLLMVYLLPNIFYHNQKKYSVEDAFYMIGGVFFLAMAFCLLIVIRNMGLSILIYLLLIATITDTYAYITGCLIGKHKLIEEISPKKTWEGLIGGTLFGVFIPVAYYITSINSNIELITIVPITLFLCFIGQFGDLVFSSIKRYFDKKDFSHIIPGHGGILDRLDSIIFIVLGYIFFINMF